MKALAIERMQQLPDKLDFASSSLPEGMDGLSDDINDSFDVLASYWQQGDYAKIVDHANDLPLYCLCDIRICVYYLYSLWTTNQQVGTERIISTLTTVLTHKQRPWQIALKKKNDKALGKIFLNSTTLFFRKMLGRLEKMMGMSPSEDESPVEVIASLEGFNESVHELQPQEDTELENLLKNITDYFFSLKVALEEKQREQNRIQQLEEENRGEEFVQLENPITVSPSAPIEKKAVLDPRIFNPSHPLKLLFKRIELLHQLVEKGHELKAAIVLEDIQRELDNFNPLLYFPEYFSSFAGLRAQQASKLEPLFCHQKSYQWQVLHEYYQTDMAAFLELEDTDEALASPPNDYIPGGYNE
ncbi:hypothetical protein EYS14_05260 [Alteromonadaceae bacterium M269]|nr:hypothetical protein EYS14_05260 [Alteromonadaceae bacterium M269]